MTVLRPGTRVLAKGQPGSINYARMAPPDYREPQVYSVFLDSKVLRPGYAGSIFLAGEVVEVDVSDRPLCSCGAPASECSWMGDTLRTYACAACHKKIQQMQESS